MITAIRLNAVTRADRNVLISDVGDAVAVAGGWIEDVHFFSNISVALHFVISAQSGSSFAKSLKAQPMTFDADDLSKLAELTKTAANEDAPCALQITFFHNEPDLRSHIPSIPG